ncbi:TPA: QVPTGV class sortase B protein-sorting domain-containing protein [Streptococcus suis]|uniref:QVPTGV class sortase B protein-sorting domain-containing protein n=1 Tax=Streptococcus suis TaxID=1307 RepID=UPI000CF748E0|nr:QVPTGV class sortase B protein-sorting domain-containing protein [Streptococcus suis]NQJ03595.1 QVPTGV class sortase B protein-sorting domain-containing protein [Streptococcus suis]NQP75132.1 QVPTGV class sortase B protein-sorting domain-containing protein [Streptococcus suis]NQP77238.1 QVPTGV class sortase B protein-sorting domain-containing protein [Streptococcus suis]NQP91635.1 QVPTGV class sortase B protein-sorting domain-containing protein [Streptococcus suis]NQP93533.1 QVPTGV class so
MKKYSFLVSGLALMMLATGTVKAEETPVVNGSSLQVTKSFELTEGVLSPATDFTFSITSQNVAGSTETKDGLTVYSGIVEGMETQKIISYSNTDTMANKDKTTDFDFSKVVYPRPGVYRYLVTETSGNTPGVTYSNKKYVVDVYVLSEGDTIKPKYIISRQEGSEAKEPIKFDNALKTTALTVTKKVTGNAGDKNKGFEFTITLKANQFYKESGKISAKINDKAGKSTPKELSIGENKFTLKDGESLSIDKLPIGITYKVGEDVVEGYQQTATIDKDGMAGVATPEDYNFTEQISDDTPDAIVVTNNKNIDTPTGVAMTIAPYAVMTLVGIGGVLYFVKNKKA